MRSDLGTLSTSAFRARVSSSGAGGAAISSSGKAPSSSSGGGMSRAAHSFADLRALGNQQAAKKRPTVRRSVSMRAAKNREAQLSLSAAKQELFSRGSMRGCLWKRGCRHRRRWVKRVFVLQGRMLTYFVDEEARARGMQRGSLELTTESRFRLVTLPDGSPYPPFAFEVVPPPGEVARQPPWQLIAATAVERSAWLTEMTRVVRLVERTETPATLRGTGSLHHHFSLGEKIGEGRFGLVRLGSAVSDGKRYAIKCINKSKCSVVRHAALRNELRVLRRIKILIGPHGAICTTFEVYESEWLLHIVMELVEGGDLFDHIARAAARQTKSIGSGSDSSHSRARRPSVSGYSESQVVGIVRQIATALAVLHSHSIVHRDLKPENILVSTQRAGGAIVVKLADFGSAMILSKTRRFNPAGAGIIAGTPGYIAPESLAGRQCTPMVDVWALGVVVFILLLGYPPFYGATEEAIFIETARATPPNNPSEWKHVSEVAKELCFSMLRRRPATRPSAAAVLSSGWLHGGASLGGSSSLLMTKTVERLLRLTELRDSRPLTPILSARSEMFRRDEEKRVAEEEGGGGGSDGDIKEEEEEEEGSDDDDESIDDDDAAAAGPSALGPSPRTPPSNNRVSKPRLIPGSAERLAAAIQGGEGGGGGDGGDDLTPTTGSVAMSYVGSAAFSERDIMWIKEATPRSTPKKTVASSDLDDESSPLEIRHRSFLSPRSVSP